jgi:hypothetical protein
MYNAQIYMLMVALIDAQEKARKRRELVDAKMIFDDEMTVVKMLDHAREEKNMLTKPVDRIRIDGM